MALFFCFQQDSLLPKGLRITKFNIFLSNIFSFLDQAVEASQKKYLKDFTFFRDEFIKQKSDFLEINLEKMKIILYEKGNIKKEFNILLKGDPYDWGGTASGIYKITSGYERAYSSIAKVYMPYALGFYGKYYIHGEPYYASGQKLISDASGGCLRLSNKDAKDLYNMTSIDLPVVVIDKENGNYFAIEKTEPPLITAQSYLVVDLDSGFIFAEKDAELKRQIASITKLMTALTISEHLDLRKTILARDYMLEGFGQTEGLEAGKRFGIVELFYPLLRESSNDAAYVLSYFLGKERTLKLMNEKAKSILMLESFFADPSGYDTRNVSTAKDLYYLARYIFLNRPLLFNITKGDDVSSFRDVSFKNLWNKNIFSQDESFLGGKTGFIKTSRYTGIFLFKMQQRNIVIIVLGSNMQKDLKTDVQKLYIWLENNYFKE